MGVVKYQFRSPQGLYGGSWEQSELLRVKPIRIPLAEKNFKFKFGQTFEIKSSDRRITTTISNSVYEEIKWTMEDINQLSYERKNNKNKNAHNNPQQNQ